MLLKNIENYIEKDNAEDAKVDIMSDMRYVCKSCALITESLQKGCDVMQLANGDIVVTELKAVTFQYSWDEKRGKLVRTQFGNKPKKTRPRKAKVAAMKAAEEAARLAEFA
jgi:hypothetical protein